MYTTLLEKIAGGLDRHKIPYMVIGGQAVLLYGEPRLTRDIDVTLGLGPDALPSLLGRLLRQVVQHPLDRVGIRPVGPEHYAARGFTM